MSVDTDTEGSPAGRLIAQLHKTGTSEYIGVVKAITTRLPIVQYATIEALSRHSGMSKNKLIVELLEVALPIALAGLDRRNRRSFDKFEQEVWSELSQQGYGETARLE